MDTTRVDEILGIMGTQPLNSESTSDEILYYAAALCRQPAHIEAHQQTAKIVTALLDLCKLAARVACELNLEEEGKVEREGFERAYKDIGSFVDAVNIEFDRNLSATPATSHPSSQLSPPPPNQAQINPRVYATPTPMLEALADTLMGDTRLVEIMNTRLFESLRGPLLKDLSANLGKELIAPVASSLMYPVVERISNAALDSLGAAALTKLATAPTSHRYSGSARVRQSPVASGSGTGLAESPRDAGQSRNTGDSAQVAGEPAVSPSRIKRARVDDDEEESSTGRPQAG